MFGPTEPIHYPGRSSYSERDPIDTFNHPMLTLERDLARRSRCRTGVLRIDDLWSALGYAKGSETGPPVALLADTAGAGLVARPQWTVAPWARADQGRIPRPMTRRVNLLFCSSARAMRLWP